MAESDYQEMLAQHQAHMREIEQEELHSASKRIQEFKAYAATRGVQLSDAAFNYSPPLGVTASASGYCARCWTFNPMDGMGSIAGLSSLEFSVQGVPKAVSKARTSSPWRIPASAGRCTRRQTGHRGSLTSSGL